MKAPTGNESSTLSLSPRRRGRVLFRLAGSRAPRSDARGCGTRARGRAAANAPAISAAASASMASTVTSATPRRARLSTRATSPRAATARHRRNRVARCPRRPTARRRKRRHAHARRCRLVRSVRDERVAERIVEAKARALTGAQRSQERTGDGLRGVEARRRSCSSRGGRGTSVRRSRDRRPIARGA